VTARRPIALRVNGADHTVEVEARTLLSDVLRHELGLTGTHVGCEQGACGACTVLADGRAIRSCLVLAPQAEGLEIETIESIDRSWSSDDLHPVQQAMADEHGLQCGFCTSGMMLTARALLDSRVGEAPLTDDEIREAISGQICRCTGYATIVRSIRWAEEHLAEEIPA
jgi:aerobic carbon-monoxide dehydrogenase small subunit